MTNDDLLFRYRLLLFAKAGEVGGYHRSSS